MTVPCSRGRSTTLCGRASATTRIDEPGARTAPPGSGRRNPVRRPGPPRPSPRPLAASTASRRRRRSIARYAQIPSGTSTSSRSIGGQMNDHGYLRRCRRRSVAIRTMARTRSSSVDSASASTPARLNASLTAASRCPAASSNRRRNRPVAGVHVELLARSRRPRGSSGRHRAARPRAGRTGGSRRPRGAG